MLHINKARHSGILAYVATTEPQFYKYNRMTKLKIMLYASFLFILIKNHVFSCVNKFCKIVGRTNTTVKE